MGTKIRFFFLSFLAVILGCQSTAPSLVKPSDTNTDSHLTFEVFLTTWETHLSEVRSRQPAHQSNWQDEFHHICSQHESLCNDHTSPSGKKKSNSRSQDLDELRTLMKQEKFQDMDQITISSSLRFFSRQKENQLIDYAQVLLKNTTHSCNYQNVKHGLASILEDYLPKEEVKTLVYSLYESNSTCPESKAAALSSYRAAMLRLIDNDCTSALPLLSKVSASSEDHLKPRSAYWSWKCQGETTDTKKNIVTQMPYFSYHRLLVDDMPQSNSSHSEKEKKMTPISLESRKQPLLNQITKLAESLLSSEMTYQARSVLEGVKTDIVQDAEPEFQVYWAHLLHSSQSGVRKFQILSSLVNNYPLYRSKAVKNMLFPTRYFEHVEANTKNLDPWLVLSLIRQESAFDPRARSPVGARGLMQLMPSTAKRIAKLHKKQLHDPALNVEAGVKFLEKLLTRFDGQVHLALAAYNAGPNRVDEWIKRYPTADTILFVDAIPYKETREYVAFILRNYEWYQSLHKVSAPPFLLRSHLEDIGKFY